MSPFNMSFFNMNFFNVTRYFLPVWLLFGVFAGLSGVVEPASAAQHRAQFANINYDVVYVRCPRGKEPVLRPTSGTPVPLLNWNGVNDLWLSATNNIYHQPGCDLVLHDSSMTPGDPAAEKVLVNCDEDDITSPVCSVVDPNVSFDGRYVVYTKFTDTRTFLTDLGIKELTTVGLQAAMKLYPDGDGPSDRFADNWGLALRPYANPALIFMYDLQTNTETQVSPDSKLFAGRAHPRKDAEWTAKIPVMDTGPFFMPDGRIGFTSNREQGFGMFQLFAMERDGRSMEVLSHRALANQLHPITLMDGRIVYTNFDRILQRTTNNNFSLFEINPDGSAPFIFAGKNDSTEWTYHYTTQLSDGDIVTTLYYNQQQTGLGALERFPVDPPGADFVHRTRLNNEAGDELTTLPDTWKPGTGLVPFARPNQFRLTPLVSAGDVQTRPYDPSEYFVHPLDGRTVTMTGRFTHPAAAPDNDLLATYAIGGSSTVNNAAFRDWNATMEMIGKDAGIWLLPLEPNSTRQIGHIADDARVVVDFPQYHEIMPRAVVSYQDIYGIPRPDPDNTRPPTRNDGTQDVRLPAGAPWGLTGAASMYDRETRSLNGTPWNMKDGGGKMSGRAYMNLAVSGAELAIFDNSEVYGIRILMPVPNIPKDIFKGDEKWSGNQRHHLRILGEYPVRKPDSNGVEPTDDQGNPDTSFIVRVPADTPFMMQTLDKRGMALDIETASRSVARGEQQFCSGCHVHTREGMDTFASRAKMNVNEFGDFTATSAPLFKGEDANGYPTVEKAQTLYAGEAGAGARRSFAVDWDNNIAPIMQNRCASCHGQGKSAQQLTGLLLDGTRNTYQLLTENRIRDGAGNTILSAGSKPGNGLTDIDAPGTDRVTPHYDCCTPSRWVSVNSARSSMLVWALYGERLDGRDPTTGLPPAGSGVVVDNQGREYPEIWPKVAEHLAHVSGMPEAEKRLIARWLDIGAPMRNVHDDMMRPVMTLTPVGGASVSSILVGLWDDSPLDFSRFKVMANGNDITPQVTGAPDIVTVPLPTAVTETNADSIEITLEIWDKPDRSWSMVRPGEAAANRTRKTVTGRALLRMAGSAANRAPTATSANITTYEDTQSTGVFAQVSDPDAGDSHLVSIVSQPSNGNAQVIDNKLVYTPGAGFVGNDSFQFRASDLGGLSVEGTANVTVLAGPPPAGGNRAPTAASASITTYENTQSDGANTQVSDPDAGDTHTIAIVSQPSNGSAQVIANKLFYTPDSGFVGNDSFQFRATDSGGLSVTGTASVTVLAASNGGNNSAPTAASASIITYENTQSDGVNAQVSDPDVGDTHIISIVSQPSNGSAQVIGNQLVYTPNSGFVGGDSFQFSARDSGGLSVTGTANVTVLAVVPSGGDNSASGGGGGGSQGPLELFLFPVLVLLLYRLRVWTQASV